MRRELNAEARLEQFHISQVFLHRDIPVSVTEHLNFWRQAADPTASDHAPSAESRSRKDPVRSVLHPVNTIAIFVKDDGVNVDLEPGTVHKNKVGLRATVLNLEALVSQNLPQLWEVRNPEDYVDVLV